MSAPPKVVFLFDCDNTLLDNDHVQADLKDRLTHDFGAAERDRYWQILEQLRTELGYVDYLGSLQRFREGALNQPALLRMGEFLLEYPFATRLYPGALETLAHVGAWGENVMLSDGDMVFQPRKLQRSGLTDAVAGRVLIYIHKEKMLDEVQQIYPADHYVMVDDKPGILSAMKEVMQERLTTVFPRQGHYALQADHYPAADLSIDHVGDLRNFDLPALLNAAAARTEKKSS